MNIGVAAALAKALGGGGGSSPSGGGLVVPHFTVRQIDADAWECTCDKAYSELYSAYEQDALIFGIVETLDSQDPTTIIDVCVIYLVRDNGSDGLRFQTLPEVNSTYVWTFELIINATNTSYHEYEFTGSNE